MTGMAHTKTHGKKIKLVAYGLIAALLQPLPAWSQPPEEAFVRVSEGTEGTRPYLDNKLLASDGTAGDAFGRGVAIDGDTAVAGAMYHDGTGAAYVFVRQGGVWIEEAKLIASDAAMDDQFGYSVAIDGDTVAIGAWNDDHGGGENAGSAYVFIRSADGWVEQAKLTASDGSSGDLFGASVALDGNTAVIGAYADNHGGSYADGGSVYVFVRSNGAWSQMAKLTPSDFSGNDEYFGFSVAVDGDTMVIGAPGEDHGSGWNHGAAYVFVGACSVWIEEAKLTASDGASPDNFGKSVAIANDTLVIGAIRDNSDTGAAYLFERPPGGWMDMTETVKLTASDASAGDGFGASVALDGDMVLVGSYLDDHDGGVDAGSAYVFVRSGNDWIEECKHVAFDAEPGDCLGRAVAMCGGTRLIGAHLDDDKGTDAGSAYVFGETGPSDFEYRCVILPEPSSEGSTTLPEEAEHVYFGEPFFVELWATDSGALNTGLVSAYADLAYPADCASVTAIMPDPAFELFASGNDAGGFVDELGGSQLAPAVGVEPEWARIAIIEFTADAACEQAVFELLPAELESSAYGRGAIDPAEIDYGSAAVEIGCRCVYDLDGNCFIGAGDLGLFAECWDCCEGEGCWTASDCVAKDFDCDGCVGGGDLGWFAVAWERSCDELDPIAEYPPCRECDGPVLCSPPDLSGGPTAYHSSGEMPDPAEAPAETRLTVLLATAASNESELGELEFPQPAGIHAGDHVYVEVWARDDAADSSGLTTVFADVYFDPSQFAVVGIDPGETFVLFSAPTVDPEAGIVRHVGGATMEAGHGAHAWTRVAVVELQALTDVGEPYVELQPSVGEAVSARGRGLIPAKKLGIIHSAAVSTRHDAEPERGW